MSPTTSIPVFPISAVIAVTFLDSHPAGCTTLPASRSFISCSVLSCDCAELITFSNSGSAFDPSRYDTTQDQCMPSKPRSANPTCQPQMFVKPEPRMPPTARLLTRQGARERHARAPFAVGQTFMQIPVKCALSNCLTLGVHSMNSS